MTSRSAAPAPERKRSSAAPSNGGSVLLTAEDLACGWQVPVSQVYRLTRGGQLPVVKLGRYYRFRLDAVEDFERDGGGAADG